MTRAVASFHLNVGGVQPVPDLEYFSMGFARASAEHDRGREHGGRPCEEGCTERVPSHEICLKNYMQKVNYRLGEF